MKNYDFEYTEREFTLKLLGICFLIFFALMIAMIVMIVKFVRINLIEFFGGFMLIIAVPFLIFFLNKKKIKKYGSATIYDSYVEFKLAGSTNIITYSNIKSYLLEQYEGTYLKIKLKDDKDFKLEANPSFCNPSQFDTFAQEFDSTLQQFKRSNNLELARKKSFYAQAWMLPFLIICTAALIGGIIFAIYKGKNMQPAFYGSVIGIILMWARYLIERNRKSAQGN